MSASTLPPPEVIAALPEDGGPDYNRLIHERSPYLLQHAANPVDWYPWGTEAFQRAVAEDKMVFLSIGYSTCHWCHVMARESFENEGIARLLNEDFICIKVDREERPDIDDIYMKATQLMTGGAGWPNSLWLTPDGRPWFAGTYFPPDDRGGRAGFVTVLLRLSDYWKTRREEVESQADRLKEAVERLSSREGVRGTGVLSRLLVERSIASLRESFDPLRGGFAGAPKFPPHGGLNLLFSEFRRTGDRSLLDMATRTLDNMARGGIHDHLGGGFHRYSTDDRWLVPHFEKMLYDNAQIARACVDAYRLTGNEAYRREAAGTFDWVLREMTDPAGGFCSAIDADSEGEEGRFYLWRRDEVTAILGPEEGGLFCAVYDIRAEGNFRDEATGQVNGTNIIHLKKPLAEIAGELNLDAADLRRRLDVDREKLLRERDKRVRPHMDDKVLAAWNGLMIGSLAYGGRYLDEPRYTAAAGKAADFVLGKMSDGGRLRRSYRGGRAGLNAYLDDYAFLIDGLLELYGAAGDSRRLRSARDLMEVLIELYLDPDEGGFFFTSRDHEDLLLRSKDPYDQAVPSGNGLAVLGLVRLADLTGEPRYLETAGKTLQLFQAIMEASPRGMETLLLGLSACLDRTEPSGKTAAADPGQPVRAYRKPVAVEVRLADGPPAPGGRAELTVVLRVDDGWHVNSHRPLQDYLTPTVVELHGDQTVAPGRVDYPEGESVEFGFSPEPMSVYRGEVRITVPLNVAPKSGNASSSIALRLNYQACDDRRCLAPESLDLEVPLKIAADS